MTIKDSFKKGDKVLIRTYSAGVHFGTFEDREGQEVLLSNAQRLWSWSGALSLSEVAQKGVDVKNSKISVKVDKLLITQAIEILAIAPNSSICKL